MESVYLWVGKIVVWGVGGGAVWCFLGSLAAWYYNHLIEDGPHSWEITRRDPVQQFGTELDSSLWIIPVLVFWPLWIPVGLVTYAVARRQVMANVRAREETAREREALALREAEDGQAKVA